MMIPERPSLERRVLSALDGTAASGPRIPVVLGGCGSGRTSLLLRVRDLLGRNLAQYIDVERIATTPERFLHAIRESTPFPFHPAGQAPTTYSGARDAFDRTLGFLGTARAPADAPATFLLDEFLELRTFESFPGLRSVLRELTTSASCATRRRNSRSSTSRRSAPRKCARRCRPPPTPPGRRRRSTKPRTIASATSSRTSCRRCRTDARPTRA
jgi:hypothetical protein